MPHLVPGVLALLVAALDEEPGDRCRRPRGGPACVPPAGDPAVDRRGPPRTRSCGETAGPSARCSTRCPRRVPAAAWRALDPDGATLDDIDRRPTSTADLR